MVIYGILTFCGSFGELSAKKVEKRRLAKLRFLIKKCHNG
jgi:hypothetical protein